MKHYLALLFESDVGEWYVVFPDAPDCAAKGLTPADAKLAAVTALNEHLRRRDVPPPLPTDIEAVQQSEEWLARNRIQLSKAVVTMIPVDQE